MKLLREDTPRKIDDPKLLQKARDIYLQIRSTNNIENIDDWFDILVPQSGKAETVAGEIVRAACRIRYRWLNDGDRFFSGYGIETCGSDAQYLMDNTDKSVAIDLEDAAERNLDNSQYDEFVDILCKDVISFLIKNKELLVTQNTVDSRHDFELDDSYVAKYDIDIEIPSTIIDYIDAGKYSEYDLESEISYWEPNGSKGSLSYNSDRINIHNGYVYIEGITEEIYNDLNDNGYRWLENLADDLMDELGNPNDGLDEE